MRSSHAEALGCPRLVTLRSRGVDLQEQLRLCRTHHDWHTAAGLYRQLRGRHPFDFRFALNHSSALWKADRLEEAFEATRRAVHLAPGEPLVWRGLGSVLKDLGRFEEAEAAYGQSQRLRDEPATRWNRAQNLMGLQRYREAFSLGEARLELDDPPPYRPGPYWSGWPEAETVVVWSEQGFGDVIQYLRWLPLLASGVRSITLELEAPLVPLVEEGMAWCLPPGTIVRPKLAGLNRRDPSPLELCQGSLLSLPHLLGGVPGEALLAAPPYLRSSRWRKPRAPGRRVGLVWAAGEQREDALLVREYRKRSLPPEVLQLLLHGLMVRDLEIVALQVGPDRDRLPPWAGAFVAELPPQADFAATAALCSQLDLVISVDTATAHLCGALDLEAWMLLPWAADSRWLRGTRTTAWYPSLRLWRQPRPGDWQGAVERMLAHLDLWCADREVGRTGPRRPAPTGKG